MDEADELQNLEERAYKFELEAREKYTCKCLYPIYANGGMLCCCHKDNYMGFCIHDGSNKKGECPLGFKRKNG